MLYMNGHGGSNNINLARGFIRLALNNFLLGPTFYPENQKALLEQNSQKLLNKATRDYWTSKSWLASPHPDGGDFLSQRYVRRNVGRLLID